MSKIKPIVIKSEGAEYVFRFKRIFQSEKDKIDQELRDIPEDNKYLEEYKTKLFAINKHGEIEKLNGKKSEKIDLATELKDFTPESESLVQAAFNYFVNSQMPDFRFLDA